MLAFLRNEVDVYEYVNWAEKNIINAIPYIYIPYLVAVLFVCMPWNSENENICDERISIVCSSMNGNDGGVLSVHKRNAY